MPSRIEKSRLQAYHRQNGLCFYCQKPLWLNDPKEFASRTGLTLRQARLLQCTAEHLSAKKDGGRDDPANIAAACLFCNRTRHICKSPLSPKSYKDFVQSRISKGKWNSAVMPNIRFPADV